MSSCSKTGYFQTEKGLVYLNDTSEKMSDADYRALINAKVQANKSSGTIVDIYNYLVTGRGMDPDTEITSNIGYSSIKIWGHDLVNQLERYLVNKIGPAAGGVTIDYAEVFNDPESAWTFEYLPFSQNLGTLANWDIIRDTVNSVDSKALRQINAAGDRCWLHVPNHFNITTAQAAYGTWEFWLKKAATSAVWIMPIASQSSAWSDGSQDGYAVNFSHDERIGLYKITAGVASSLFFSAVSTYDNDWNKWTITRDADDEFSVYLNGSLVSAASGTNPLTDTTYTTSTYIVNNLDEDDEISLCSREDAKQYIYTAL